MAPPFRLFGTSAAEQFSEVPGAARYGDCGRSLSAGSVCSRSSARTSSTWKTVRRGPNLIGRSRPAATHAQNVEREIGSGPRGRKI